MNYAKQCKALNPKDIPMIDTDYYKFMSDGGYHDNRIECKLAYLADRFGFVKGTDRIDEDCINTLTHIHNQYFSNKLKPALDEKLKNGYESGKYKIVPEYWTQPGAVRYSYVAPDRTVWNIDHIDNNHAHLWAISGYGATNHRSVNLYEFDSTYKRINQPSMYEAMDAVSK